MADTASVCIPELQFEIPSHSHKGSVTTVESIITKAATQLEQEQPERKVHTLTRHDHFLIGASLIMSESYTSVTPLHTRVCIYLCLDRPLTVNFK